MKRFWLFRSNLTSLEYYHEFKDLESFLKNCHDYYMLFPMWLLKTGYFNEVTVWRMTSESRPDIVFNVGKGKYIQKWCKNFSHTLDFPSPDVSFWRGGFREYDNITKTNPKQFGFKIYLGAGQRVNAQWGGKYDMFLMEDDLDLKNNPGTLPFYKTASPFVFFPYKNGETEGSWDICWPCNFTQLRYKGQEFFIRSIAKSKYLRKLKILHCGNKPEVGKRLCTKYGVTNIRFVGSKDRKYINHILNFSKFGLNLSNRLDGCPRVSTEILMAGTPLIIHEDTRLLSYYKQKGVVEVNNDNIANNIKFGMDKYGEYKKQTLQAISDELSFDVTNQKNIDLWKMKF